MGFGGWILYIHVGYVGGPKVVLHALEADPSPTGVAAPIAIYVGTPLTTPEGVSKFNVDGATREIPGLADIRGVLCNSEIFGYVLQQLQHFGTKEAKVLAIPEIPRIFSPNFHIKS